MSFSEAVRDAVKKKAHYTCCWCRDRRNKVDVHHIKPEADEGTDDFDNAAPLCGSCHDLYGDNPYLRKEIRGRRDQWYEYCAGVSETPRAVPFMAPHPNPFFTGCEGLLRALHKQLTMGQGAAISGLGGIGKTQTAVQYAHRYRESHPAGIFYVLGATMEGLISGFSEIAREIGLPTINEEIELVKAVLRWLTCHDGWLLVLDNIDNPDLVRPYIPNPLRGHLLVTSRVRDLAILGIGKTYRMELMPPDLALEFLLRRVQRCQTDDEEMEAARQLAEELGYLPLALEQAGAYVFASETLFCRYLMAYRTKPLETLERSRPRDYPTSVAKTWLMSFEAVEKISPAAVDVLRASAFLASDEIPDELLVRGGSELGEAISAVFDGDSDSLAMENVLEPLLRYSFVERNSKRQTWRVHRLIQAVMLDRIGAEGCVLWRERVLKALRLCFPWPEQPSVWVWCERLLSHALAVVKHGTGDIVHADLSDSIGFFLLHRARYDEAESLIRCALEIRIKIQGQEHQDVAQCINNLGVCLQYLGRYTEALDAFERASAIYSRLLPSEMIEMIRSPLTPKHSQTIANIANLYHLQGSIHDSEETQRGALEIRKMALGDKHPDTASSHHNLAIVLHGQGRNDEAKNHLQIAIEIRREVLEKDHPDLASSLHSLAVVLIDEGQLEAAKPLLQETLAIYTKRLGEEHPHTCEVRRKLHRLELG